MQIVLGRFAGGEHVAGAIRLYRYCDGVAVVDAMHMICECSTLHTLESAYTNLDSSMLLCFTNVDTMRSFFAQQNHMQVSEFVASWLAFSQV